MQTQHRDDAGFTLIEVLLAIAITATIMVTVGSTFHVLLNARDVVDELAESTEAGPRILNLIERDLNGLWTYNIRNNAVFRGRDMDVFGQEADRMDFLTTTDSVGFVRDVHDHPFKTTICEVGYWFKPNPRIRELFEMWRREDPMVDDELTTQGSFQLVHDRVKSFKVTYYDSLGYEALPKNEWDSSVDDQLPKRIKVEFTIERRRQSRNVVSDLEIDDFEGAEKTYVRHFVLDSRLKDILQANSARLPVRPPEPVAESAGGGAAGGPASTLTTGTGNMASQEFGAGRGGPEGGKGGRGGRGGGDGGGKETTTFGTSGGRTPGGRAPGGAPPGGGTRPGGGQVPQLPPGFNLGDLLGGLGGGGGGGLFGGH